MYAGFAVCSSSLFIDSLHLGVLLGPSIRLFLLAGTGSMIGAFGRAMVTVRVMTCLRVICWALPMGLMASIGEAIEYGDRSELPVMGDMSELPVIGDMRVEVDGESIPWVVAGETRLMPFAVWGVCTRGE